MLDLIDSQVRALRQRQLIDSYEALPGAATHREGAYWGIRTDIAKYKLPDSLSCPSARTTDLAATPTRLKRLDEERQERLINWGYAICDAALRAHVALGLPAGTFPYPQTGV